MTPMHLVFVANGGEVAENRFATVCPVTGDEVHLEQALLGASDYVVEKIRRIYTDTGAHTNAGRLFEGTAFGVAEDTVYVYLQGVPG